MSSNMEEYLKKYTGNSSKSKSRKKKNKGLIITDNALEVEVEFDKNVKPELKTMKVDNLEKLKPVKMEIKNGIDAINETKINYELKMRSKYSNSNFVTISGKNEEIDLKVDKNNLKVETIREEPLIIKKKRHDSDDDLDIERPILNLTNSTRKVVEAEIIGGKRTEEIENEGETVYRDRETGKKVDLKLEKIEKRRAEERNLEISQQYQKWGTGLKQLSDKNKKYEDDEYEMSKPLSRYADDEDLENYLKSQERVDDPMFEYMMKKKRKKMPEKSEKKIDDRVKYKGPMCEPNRFGILPGHRWDGVDRSNGFERKRFKCIAERKALDYESYKWDIEEM